MTNSPARIERREYKYLVGAPLAQAIRQSLQPFCELDPYASQAADHSYTIDSCYLDSPDLTLYRASENEQLDRLKLRARSYPDTGARWVFLEVKRRFNDVIIKTRGRIFREQYAELLSHSAEAFRSDLGEGQHEGVETFLNLVHLYAARPVLMVRYSREAWTSQIDDYARVTFDRQIRGRVQHDFSLERGSSDWRYIDSAEQQKTARSLILVELKFTQAVPSWMSHMVQRFDLQRTAFSKYGSAVRSWHREPHLLTTTF